MFLPNVVCIVSRWNLLFFGTTKNPKDNFCIHESIFQWKIKSKWILTPEKETSCHFFKLIWWFHEAHNGIMQVKNIFLNVFIIEKLIKLSDSFQIRVYCESSNFVVQKRKQTDAWTLIWNESDQRQKFYQFFCFH